MGVFSDALGSQVGALIVLLVCIAFLLFLVSPKVTHTR